MHWGVEGVERVARMRLDDLQAQTAKASTFDINHPSSRLPWHCRNDTDESRGVAHLLSLLSGIMAFTEYLMIAKHVFETAR